MRRLLPLLLVVVLAGCAARRTAAVPGLLSLRGQGVLLVDVDGERVELRRELGGLPWRLYPSEADSTLEGQLGDLKAAGRAAELRRLPWLVVADDEGLRVLTARGFRELWRGQRGAALRRELGAEGEPARLAPLARIQALRRAVLAGAWEQHAAQLADLVERFGDDPALRWHEALRAALLGEGEAGFALAAALNPDGESELFALALRADQAAKPALAQRLRTWLVRTYPERLDYYPPLVETVAQEEGDEAAVALCRSALGRVERPAELTPGSAPHEAPAALPWADLRYALGFRLWRSGDGRAALLALEAALDVYEPLGRRWEEADALNTAGAALVELGRPMAGVASLRKALRLRELQGDRYREATTTYNLARALHDARRLSDARETYELAAERYLAGGWVDDGLQTRVEIVPVDVALEDFGGAERRCEALLTAITGASEITAARRDELLAPLWTERGKGRAAGEDHPGALAAFARAAKLWEVLDRPLERGQVAWLRALPHVALLQFEAAWSDLIEALTLAVEAGDSDSILVIRDTLGSVEGLLQTAGLPVPEVPAELIPWLGRSQEDGIGEDG